MIIEEGTEEEFKECLIENVGVLICINCGDKTVPDFETREPKRYNWCLRCQTRHRHPDPAPTAAVLQEWAEALRAHTYYAQPNPAPVDSGVVRRRDHIKLRTMRAPRDRRPRNF